MKAPWFIGFVLLLLTSHASGVSPGSEEPDACVYTSKGTACALKDHCAAYVSTQFGYTCVTDPIAVSTNSALEGCVEAGQTKYVCYVRKGGTVCSVVWANGGYETVCVVVNT